jgi:hypothetical protein
VLAALWILADAAEEGRKVILSMLVVGLVFVGVIVVVGDVLHHYSLKRESRRSRTL